MKIEPCIHCCRRACAEFRRAVPEKAPNKVKLAAAIVAANLSAAIVARLSGC